MFVVDSGTFHCKGGFVVPSLTCASWVTLSKLWWFPDQDPWSGVDMGHSPRTSHEGWITVRCISSGGVRAADGIKGDPRDLGQSCLPHLIF